jgi:predicted acetyltransferase
VSADDLRPLRPDEAEDAARRARSAFGATGDLDAVVARLRLRAEEGILFGLADGRDRIVAHAGIWTTEHWFGGRRVRCQHVGGVSVAPEDRGRGAARALMEAAVRRGADAGAGLSLLFPATTRLYRRLGWEHAGHYARYTLAARSAPSLDLVDGPPLRPVAGDGDWTAIRACAAAANAARTGVEERDDEDWADLRAAAFAYVLDGADGALEAYALVDHTPRPSGWQYQLELTDWAATSPRGLRSILAFVARHGTTADQVQFRDTVPTAFALLVPEQDIRLESDFWWMARGLDLPAAIGARGYPAGVAGAVTLSVADPLLPTARGPWRFEVADGRAQLEPTDDAPRVRLDARAVGPLYSGFRSADVLALAGLLDGPDEDRSLLTAAFAGTPPAQLDFF